MYQLNDFLILKKQHPCGGVAWEVVRVGADIKIRCATCGKYVNLTRDELKKRIKIKKIMPKTEGENNGEA